ncbi:MAG: hypothetical protein KAH33_00815 [Candidatus Delongbacteria bacterium]|nr:hypothetical protein [Candidatus Delongbacteria bacterium]
MKRNLIITLMLFVAILKLQAQDKKIISGNSFSILLPQKELAEVYEVGLGIYANFDYELSEHFAARLDLGWNDVAGPENEYQDTDGNTHTDHTNTSIWEISGGLKANLSIFYVEIRGGYFTTINDWGYIPAVGLRLGIFDIQGNYSFVGDSEWAAVRMGFYWK